MLRVALNQLPIKGCNISLVRAALSGSWVKWRSGEINWTEARPGEVWAKCDGDPCFRLRRDQPGKVSSTQYFPSTRLVGNVAQVAQVASIAHWLPPTFTQ